MSGKKAPSVWNLESQIGFYAAYHNNPINQLIHVVFVPTILWTVLVWLTFTGPLVELDFLPKWLPLNGSLIVASLYNLYYIILDPIAGSLYIPFLGSLLYAANTFAAGNENAVPLSIGIHVVSWIAQFIGHGAAEGRAPSLLDNLFQSLVLAPLFVWLEVLFFVGYKPALAKKIDAQAKQDIITWKASLEKAKVAKAK